MVEFYCLTSSPVSLGNNENLVIPPVIFLGKAYILNEKTLQDVLEKVCLLRDFIMTTREKGYEYIPKWLKSKNLLNKAFLETTSSYWIDNFGVKRISSYKNFQTDSDNGLFFEKNYFLTYWKKVLLYKYVKSKHFQFNLYVNEKLEAIKKEWEVAEDSEVYKKRRKYYRKNLFNNLLQNFIVNLDFETKDFIETLNCIDVSLKSELNSNDLRLYKTGDFENFKNNNFKMKNIAQTECIKENTFIKFKSIINEKDFEELLDYSKELTLDKLNFDRHFIFELINNQNENKPKHIIDNYSASYRDSKIKMATNHDSSHINESNGKCLSMIKSKNFLTIQNVFHSNNETFYDNNLSCYCGALDNSNVLISSKNDLIKNIVSLNLSSSNIEKIDRLIFNKKNATNSSMVNFSVRNHNKPYLPLGYAQINRM